ncbi:hypothetical protein GC173_08255 [bacterium]|nr:hypothetical protein [bacterium]
MRQAMRDGWSVVEIGSDLTTFRWGANDRVGIRFEGDLAPGKYQVRMQGFRQPYPTETVEFRAGRLSSGLAPYSGTMPNGYFDLRIPFELKAPLANPQLWIDSPTWSPKDFEDSPDGRTLAFLFSLAWIEKATD